MPCARSLSGYRGVRRNGYSLHVGTEMRRCAPRAYLMQSRDISAPVGKDRGQSEHIGTVLIGIRRGFAHFGTYLLETVRRFAYIDGLARDRMRILRVRMQEGSAAGNRAPGADESSALRRRCAKSGCIFKIRKRITLFFQRNWGKAFQKICAGTHIWADFGADFAVIPRVMRADVHRT